MSEGGGGMKVRNRLLSAKEYKGRPTEARDSLCPCRPCWHAHDCGYTTNQGERIVRMECATRWNSGCPIGPAFPQHIFTPWGCVCKRCGFRRTRTEMVKTRAEEG